ncbi:hypothetical protein FQN57_004696 [Myotisia sp. PD_48]|nr:hypothetical protein FQN57_004696 [Myotisia sp. PD_48]
MEAEASTSPPTGPGPCHLLRLPSETIGDILRYLNTVELATLCRVSKSIHGLAVSELYRIVENLFYDANDQDEVEESVEELAGILNTLTTSDFNYASFIKILIFDTNPNNDNTSVPIQVQVAHRFKQDDLCAKFFHNLLVATIKKISALERFEWNIRVGLSPAVFEALGRIPSLQYLRVRMPEGLPARAPPSPSPPPPVPIPHPPMTSLVHGHQFGTPAPPPPAFSHKNPPIREDPSNGKRWGPNRNFGYFSHLKVLEIFDIDNLDSIDEIAECISSSAGTLKTLRLSFSDRFSATSRPPKPGVNPNNAAPISETSSVNEDDYDIDGFPPPPPPPAQSQALNFTSSNSNAASIRQIRTAQEQALERIFSLDKVKNTNPTGDLNRESTGNVSDGDRNDPPLSSRLAKAINLFVASINDNGNEIHISDNELLIKQLTDVASKLVEPKEAGDINDSDKQAEGSSSKEGDQAALEAAEAKEDAVVTPEEPQENPTETSKPKDRNPMDARLEELVDMEHPDEINDEDNDDQEFLETNNVSQNQESTGESETSLTNGEPPSPDVEPFVDAKGKGKVETPADTADVITKPATPGSDTDTKDQSDLEEQHIQEYVREHHGIPLEHLALHLIPLKASIISRGVDIWALKHISLLSVGPQRPFWNLLRKCNATNPLSLKAVHTDNVSMPLLQLLNSIQDLEEVFLIELAPHSNSPRGDPAISIKDIRELVLEKHMPGLKRLMIRNDTSSRWCLDLNSVLLITKFGGKLAELMAPLKSSEFHILMQGINNLRSLHVLHTLFTERDYCQSLLHEIQVCAIDNVLRAPSIDVRFVATSFAARRPEATRVVWLQPRKRPAKPGVVRVLRTSDIPEGTENLSDDPARFEFLNKVRTGVPTDGDDFDVEFVESENYAFFQDEPGIKIWEKGIWTAGL